MTSVRPHQPHHGESDHATVTTLVEDATRAHLRLGAGVPVADALGQALHDHLAAGRRFLRLDVSAADTLDRPTLRTLVDAHRRLLRRRGTLILTGAGDGVMRALADASCTQELFVLGRFADTAHPVGRPAWG